MIELGENRVHCEFEDGKIGLLLDMRESICLLMHASVLGCEYITKVEEIDRKCWQCCIRQIRVLAMC